MVKWFRARQRAGFTLTEMVVTIVIIGAFAALAIPRYTATVERFHSREGAEYLMAVLGAQKRYSIDNNGNYAGAFADLDIGLPSSGFRYFQGLTVANDPTNVAHLDRVSGGNTIYDLEIDEDGTISCGNGTGNICSKMGY